MSPLTTKEHHFLIISPVASVFLFSPKRLPSEKRSRNHVRRFQIACDSQKIVSSIVDKQWRSFLPSCPSSGENVRCFARLCFDINQQTDSTAMLYEPNNNKHTYRSRGNVYAKEIYSLIKMSFDQIEKRSDSIFFQSTENNSYPAMIDFSSPSGQFGLICLHKDEHTSTFRERKGQVGTPF